ncbi:PadR family transcriptional regulator [Umezawaea endophytica]|uniref:PadR family transcriptional regulator n=1 Tax=Umezawaea endophytica TaxID=1654476 RepID=A0A9X3ALF2_9PSEU|nr:PadR family transcriptional regulator [Umezawaea endophytica]MCS7484335.1 PadR family transcriptional regulator [Umezawaea endophytica]
MVAIRPLAMVVLELLHESPMHPYEIQQKIHERQLGRLTKVTVGSLYHAVEKLQKDGLIEVVDTSREGKRPERTTYRLTSSGVESFRCEVLANAAEVAVEFPRFAMAVQHLHTVRPGEAVAELRLRAKALREGLGVADVTIAELTARNLEPMFWIDHQYTRAMRQAELDWVERLVDRLSTGELVWPEAARRRVEELEEDRR